MNRLFLMLWCFSLFGKGTALSRTIYLPKPVYQINFGHENNYGLELGVWNKRHYFLKNLRTGWDIGLLGSPHTLETYADFQIGMGILGISQGIYVMRMEKETRYGIQFSLWANVFAGINLKQRIGISSDANSSAGIYAAIPLRMFLRGAQKGAS
ncbi:hypothetical protein ACFL5V_06820 [Fibrobacterota bacterium]